MADDGNVVSFRPRSDGGSVPLPPLPAAPRPEARMEAPPVVEDAGPQGPAASMSGLPGVGSMAPPLALLMPPPPPLGGGSGGGPGDGEGDGEEGEGEFAPPSPADPENPTGRETLQICMAIMAAMGVAAAQGMWHRARHRQALADQSRAAADRSAGKAAGGGQGGGSRGSAGPKGGGALTGSRQEGGSRRRSHDSSRGGHDSSSPFGHDSRRKRRKRDHGDGGGADGHNHKAPKSTRGGRTAPDAGPGRSKLRKGSKNGRIGKGIRALKRRRGGKSTPGDESTKRRGRKRGPGADKSAPSSQRQGRKLTWKAAKSRPGPGGGKAITGRKRWIRTAPGASMSGGKRGKGKRRSERRTWARWKSSPAWVKRWRTRHKAAASSTSSTGSAGSTGPTSSTVPPRPGSQKARQSWTRTPPPPPPGWEKMRPPPGSDRTVRVTVERVDDPPRPRQESPVLAGAPVTRQHALPPAAARSTTTRPQTTGGQMSPRGSLVPAPRTSVSTQYADADLTVYDVIEADADMAEEITDGVAEARRTADGCEQLMTRLETLHAKVVELQVPGMLAGWLMRLMDKTGTVRARALAIAANLPAAAEAISVAGSNAAARHQNPADVTRDMGHIRPADAEYHNE